MKLYEQRVRVMEYLDDCQDFQKEYNDLYERKRPEINPVVDERILPQVVLLCGICKTYLPATRLKAGSGICQRCEFDLMDRYGYQLDK